MNKTADKKILLGNKTALSYVGLAFVVFIWGIAPIITLELYKYYSPTFRTAVTETLLIIFFVIVSRKKLKHLNLKYLKVALPFGLCYSLANIIQKIGLQYTTPAKYAFLENLSCVVVPFLLFAFARKKPTLIKIFACVLCLVSVFVLNGISFNGFSFGIGEILCGAAGLLYGVNIAGTGVYAKDLDTSLYLVMQFAVSSVLSFAFAFILAYVPIGGTVPLEPIRFSFDIRHILFAVAVALGISGFCWLIRVNALKYVDPTVVGVIMPFSAVVTSVVSVIMGTDKFSPNLIIGGILGVAAIILSEVGDNLFKKRKSESRSSHNRHKLQ